MTLEPGQTCPWCRLRALVQHCTSPRCTGYALATHWISDTIDVSPEARRAADAATEAAAQRLITPAVSDLDDLPPAPPLSERQLRSRAAFERLADASSIR